MIYCRFPKEDKTKVVDYRIDNIQKSLTIHTETKMIPEYTYFVGGPFSSLDKIKKLKENNISFINIDKGYFSNKKVTSHWRLSFNSFQQNKIFDVPGDRLAKFNIKIQDWKTKGSYILILAPSCYVLDFYKISEDPLTWSLKIKDELLNYTDRKIFIRFKNKKNDKLRKYLDDCYAVITLQSIGCVESTIWGIPVISLGESCINLISKNKLENIENLQYSENRYNWLKSLSYGQFDEKELASGYAMEIFSELNKEIQ